MGTALALSTALPGMLSGVACAAEGESVDAPSRPAPVVPGFDVWEYRVEGITLLKRIDVERAVYPFLGPERTIRDVEGARRALEKAYRDAGYATVVVDIPEQQVAGGVVRLRVTESQVSEIRVVGSRYYSQGRILKQVPSVSEGSVPQFVQFQDELQVVNRFPGVSVTPVLRPGQQTGTTEIDLNVADVNPFSASVELNNRYSPNTTEPRLYLEASYANLWQRQHTLSFVYQTAPEEPEESRAAVLSYLMPVPDSKNLLALYAVRSRSDVAAVGGINVLGDGDVYGARLVMPLPQGEKLYHSFTFGLDYKDFLDNVVQPGLPALETPLRYVPMSLLWSGSIADEKGPWQFSTGLVLGLRGPGGSEGEDFDRKRFKADGNFVAYKWEVARERAFGEQFSVFGRFDGQIADQALVSNEQFFAGGVKSVRGYLESEVIGDNGVHVSVELRGPRFWQSEINSRGIQPHVFVEGSYLTLIDPLPGQQDEFAIASFGLGVRGGDGRYLDFYLEAGYALRETLFTDEGELRLQGSAKLGF